MAGEALTGITDRERNGLGVWQVEKWPPKMSMSSSLEIVDMLVSWQRGFCRCDFTEDLETILDCRDRSGGPSVITRSFEREGGGSEAGEMW